MDLLSENSLDRSEKDKIFPLLGELPKTQHFRINLTWKKLLEWLLYASSDRNINLGFEILTACTISSENIIKQFLYKRKRSYRKLLLELQMSTFAISTINECNHRTNIKCRNGSNYEFNSVLATDSNHLVFLHETLQAPSDIYYLLSQFGVCNLFFGSSVYL